MHSMIPRRIFRERRRPATPAPSAESRQAAGHATRALEHHNAGRHAEAIAEWAQVRRLEPDNWEAANNRAVALAALGWHGQAVDAYREAIRLDPHAAVAHAGLGASLRSLGRPGDAAAACREAIRLDASVALAHGNLGVALADLGDAEAATAAHRRAVELEPRSPHHLRNLAAALRLACRESDAIEAYDAVLAIEPGDARSRACRGAIRLAMGDPGGWIDFEGRHDRPHVRGREIPGVPRWRGQELAGNLLLNTTLDGYGDAVMGIRFAAAARARVGATILYGPTELARLIGRVPGVDRVVTRREDLPAVEAQTSVLDLVGMFGATPAAVRGDPYLAAEPGEVGRWRPAVESAPGLRVGISWQGNPEHPDDRRRSFRLADLAPMAAVPGVSLISLQKGQGAEQVAEAGFPVYHFGAEYAAGDWGTTAAVTESLDLVVAPDTAIAHLAGALGRPVWIALGKPAEWRWGRAGETTPWYSGATLWRQERPGEWGPVFRRLAGALPTITTRYGDGSVA